MPQKVVFVTLNHSPAEGVKHGVLEIPELAAYLIDGYSVKEFKQMVLPKGGVSGPWIDVIFILEK